MRRACARIAAALAVLTATILLAACGSDESQGGGRKQLDLRIGVIAPSTGFLSQFGDPGKQAADLAVDEIRKAAAKAGARHKVTLTPADDQSLPGNAVLAAKKMEAAGTDCIVGPWFSAGAERVATRISAPLKVLQITPAASGDVLTKTEDRGYLNRVVPPDRLQAQALVELLDQKLRGARGKKVNVGLLESTYGKGLQEEFKDAWTTKGGQVASEQAYRPDQPTFADAVNGLAKGKPDAWVFFDFIDTYARIANDLLTQTEAGFTPKKAFATDSLALQRLAASSPNGTEGLRGVAIGAPKSGAPAEEFDRRYAARGESKRQTFDAQAFDATVLCYLSAVAAGSAKGSDMQGKVRDLTAPPGKKFSWLQLDQAIKALEAGQDIDYEGASGPIDMNDDGDATAGIYDVYEFKGGKLRERDQIAVPERPGGI